MLKVFIINYSYEKFSFLFLKQSKSKLGLLDPTAGVYN